MPIWQIIAAAVAVFAVLLMARALKNGSYRRIRETDHRQPATPDLGDGEDVLDSLDPEIRGQVLDYVRQNRKINAIRDLRAATGLGLKESKDIIDALSSKMNG